AVIGEAAGIVIALLVAVSVVTLAVAAAILAASAASEVQRRLQAIGVLRALGASPRDVVAGHVVEAALVAAPAAAVGVAAGAAAVVPKTADLLVSLNELPPAASTLLALLAAVWLGTVAVVGAAAAVPAARAVRRPPVAAMR